MLLIGLSGVGKTTLTRFVSWMNGFTFLQLSIHKNYSASDFDEDLKNLLIRAGLKNEKICFMLDEGDLQEASMLERMNTLLANGEIPGLFENEDAVSLLSSCKETAIQEGVPISTEEATYQWFRGRIMRNLHVVISMSPPVSQEFLKEKLTASPALFNRCVINWMGDWCQQSFSQIASELLQDLDIEFSLASKASDSPSNIRERVVEVISFIHTSTQNVASDLARQHHTSVLVTPQQFLSFIASFKSVFKEKCKSLEEYQQHVVSGLEQISDTLDEVGTMKAKLSVKETELSTKTAEANEKLARLIKDQQEAEVQKTASLALQKVIGEQEEQIAARKDIVLSELAKVEPLVKEAQESVSSIKRAHLQELKTMSNPPEAVKMTLESVCIMLGHKVDSWRAIQSVARKDDFISNITNYETSQLSRKSREEIETTYMSNKSFAFDVVNRASKACGPLLQWVVAQIGYAGILDKVSPLRQEVLNLEAEASRSREEAVRVDASLGTLEIGINHYREEYAKLIAETEVMKSEMELISRRVDRSTELLQNLSTEKDRWEMSRYVRYNRGRFT